MRRRLDAELVRRGLSRSRADAVASIKAGLVTVGGAPTDNPARLVDDAVAVHIDGPAIPFVSRGGLKLAAALDAFEIDPSGLRWLDAGASTGGFTDCLLQRHAREVVAVDVGHGQLAWSIRSDPRVIVFEHMNVRHLTAEAIDGIVDGCVADLSFISLRAVAPALIACTERDGPMALLIKPQFEAGPQRLGKGGIVRDVAVRAEIVGEVVDALHGLGTCVVGLIPSPISGADGNREFVAHCRSTGVPLSIDHARRIVSDDAITTLAVDTGQNET